MSTFAITTAVNIIAGLGVVTKQADGKGKDTPQSWGKIKGSIGHGGLLGKWPSCQQFADTKFLR